jgi:hypothetical protein
MPSEWRKFGNLISEELRPAAGYDAWLEREREARTSGLPLRPFVRVPITFAGWKVWTAERGETRMSAAI